MTNKARAQRKCQVCGLAKASQLRSAITVRPVVSNLVAAETGHWDENGWICIDDLQRFRRTYVEQLLRTERGELTDLEHEVIESLRKHELLARDPDREFEANLDLGERAADRIASFGGSWLFMGLFALVLVGWMVVNSVMLGRHPFDPYPYILLNLVLSCLAAVQAPVIMMSQNRQEARDRSRAESDYQVNLKAELEIRHLHQKLDHLLSRQWERLVEIQDIQMELMGELRKRD